MCIFSSSNPRDIFCCCTSWSYRYSIRERERERESTSCRQSVNVKIENKNAAIFAYYSFKHSIRYITQLADKALTSKYNVQKIRRIHPALHTQCVVWRIFWTVDSCWSWSISNLFWYIDELCVCVCVCMWICARVYLLCMRITMQRQPFTLSPSFFLSLYLSNLFWYFRIRSILYHTIGMRGNLTETAFSMHFANTFSVMTIIVLVYYLVWQTYV